MLVVRDPLTPAAAAAAEIVYVSRLREADLRLSSALLKVAVIMEGGD